ncbi:hypothetical protein MMC26_007168, partial [Xylographa opegraphella]|nr:hypothetical protein [Xylographa opegraphella]
MLGTEVRKILNTLEQFAAKVLILEAENEDLKRAVYIEKKRKKRGKSMFNTLRDNDLKAVFFNSAKIRQARELAILKNNKKTMQTEQKAIEKQERLIQKKAKAAEIAQRKFNKENARIQKAQDSTKEKAIKKRQSLLSRLYNEFKAISKSEPRG